MTDSERLPALPDELQIPRGDDDEPVFAQALANTLKVKQGIFLSYQRLSARVLSLLTEREFLLNSLLPDYRALAPALHPLLHEDRIDTGALAYAVARLPEGVTRTNFYYLTGDLPPLYAEPDEKFTAVATKARRRAACRRPGTSNAQMPSPQPQRTSTASCAIGY